MHSSNYATPMSFLHPVLPDEGQVDPQGPVGPRAVYAEEHTIGDAGPAGVFSCAVKTNLKKAREQRIKPYLWIQTSQVNSESSETSSWESEVHVVN